MDINGVDEYLLVAVVLAALTGFYVWSTTRRDAGEREAEEFGEEQPRQRARKRRRVRRRREQHEPPE
jgi:hypothetical protein